MVKNSIYISIASYRDSELIDTIISAINNSVNPKQIYFSIVSQADHREHPDLDCIKDFVGNIFYHKIYYKDSMGACWARSLAQNDLSKEYNYFLQIDSHTRFAKKWDERIISNYENSKKRWPNMIYTTYVFPYYYEDNKIQYAEYPYPTAACLHKTKHAPFFEGRYKDYEGDHLGFETNYFSGHFAFGDALIFLDTPYDKELYFSGEEPSLAARFNNKDIKLIVPPFNFMYHRYDRKDRVLHWEDMDLWWEIDLKSKQRLEKFFNGDYLDGYGVSDINKLEEWKKGAREPFVEQNNF